MSAVVSASIKRCTRQVFNFRFISYPPIVGPVRVALPVRTVERMWVFAGGDDTTDVREWALRSGNSRCTGPGNVHGEVSVSKHDWGLYLSRSPGPEWQRETWKAHVQMLSMSNDGKRVSVADRLFARPI